LSDIAVPTGSGSDTHQINASGRLGTHASKPNGFRAFLSAVWIIGLPAIVWIAVFEFANYVLFFALPISTRLTVAAVLLGLFTAVWALVSATAHQEPNRPR